MHFGRSMVPVLDAEKGWGGLGKQKFLESFRLSTHLRRIKGYGAPGRLGGVPLLRVPSGPDSHPHHSRA